MKKADVVTFFHRLAEHDPHPVTELEYSNPFTLLVAVALSAQMTDAGVNKATRSLFAVADTPEKMAALGLDAIRDYVRTINFNNTKAKNVLALSEALVRDHGGVVPEDRAALEALPGVGRKTANVVLNTAFGHETFAVDTHIFRVCNRTKLAPGKDVVAVEHKLDTVVPQPFRLHAHHWLILHGRYTCKARKPECWRCIVVDLCPFKPKTPPPKSAAGAAAAGESTP
ncbi:endonuclease III [uncultured Sphingomonas sp.]|uniref:endonuclease III n=1 Tax=uncultured Sphingomonas sp. TaxID=158754 RepID=UPI0025E288A8|nr:endonuclease III [uncultured Sphingomonas sp.]